MKLRINKSKLMLVLISCLLCIVFIVSVFLGLTVGSSKIDMFEVFNLCFRSDSVNPLSAKIIWNIRLPRVLMAGFVGASLSLGGLVLQVLLRNPLAEPYTLGISGGAAIGAILGILSGFSRFPGIAMTAFAGSIITVILLLFFVSTRLVFNKNSFVLAGVMINSFCSAVIMFFVSVVHDSNLHNIMFWLMGDFSSAVIDEMWILIVFLIICFLVLFLCSNWMNLLQLGEDLAQSMGVNVRKVSMILLLCASLMISITVSYCGLIGFVGLVIPHFFRLIFTADHRLLIPTCLLGGSAYLIICDVISRVLLDQGEIPVGVVTALIGAPVFISLLILRTKS